MLEITVKNRKSSDQQNYKLTQSSIVLGRQRDCDIPLDSASVSRKHAKIEVSNHQVSVIDLGSGNGTRVEQKKLIPNEPQTIQPGQKILIEEFEVQVSFKEPAHKDLPKIEIEEESLTHADQVKPVDQNDEMIEIKMIKKVLGALDQDKFASLLVIDEKFEGLKGSFEEGQDEMVIGREPNCDMQINTSMVSRRHAVIALKWGSYVITDLSSKNGTFVNGEQVTEKSIRDGDEIIIGTIKCVFKNPQEFDVDAIAKSLQHESKAKDQINQDLGGPVKKENTSSFSKQEIDKESDSENKVSKEALASLGEDNSDEDNKKDKEPEDNPNEDNAPVKKKKSKSKDTKQKHPTKPAVKSKSLMPQFSTLEWALFGFGALVIVIVLAVMLYLFS